MYAQDRDTQSYKMAKSALNATYKKLNKTTKKYLIKFLKWSAPVLLSILGIILLLFIIVSIIGAMFNKKQEEDLSPPPTNSFIEQYSNAINTHCYLLGISDFANVIKAIMQQESGGQGLDPMQSSECEFNTRFPQKPNSITDPYYSIEVGVKYFNKALSLANCTSPDDTDTLMLALQGYNFGTGYITWAIKNHDGYSKENASEFSDIQANKLGWSSYGDKLYTQKVIAYYNSYATSVSGFINPVPSARLSSKYGWRILNGASQFHKGIDLGTSTGTPILASMSGEVIQSDWSSNGYGYRVKIKHSNGYITHYAHCSKLMVKQGDVVNQGDPIALVGNTGDSYGSHLHWEVITPTGQYLDGESLIDF